jgi:hypothetical protein
VKEPIAKKDVVRSFNQFHGRAGELPRRGLPHGIGLSAHLIKKLAKNFLFVPKVKVEIARADLEVCSDMVRRHGNNTVSVEEIN